MDKKVWIIIGVVLGTLVLLLVMTLGLFFWRRSKKRIHSFTLRAVTPLDDAEFESWRRPSQYTKRPEKYGIRSTQPRSKTQTPELLEKELNIYVPPRTPSPVITTKASPSSPIRKPERVRRKSSVCSSIADRPPTPYSPASASGEFPRRTSHNSRKAGSSPHTHYPSMSESSAYGFNFGLENSSPPDSFPGPRQSQQSDRRPLHYSYARYGESL